MRTPPTSPSKATAPAELPRAKSAPQLRDRDSPDNVQQTPPPVPPIQALPPAVDAPRPPASPNSGEARRTLTAVLDALMGTADGHRRDRALRLENGSRVADYVRDHPDGAYTVRLFGDGFTIRREGDESIPKPPARKRPRRGGVHTSSSGVLVVLRLAPSTRRRRHSVIRAGSTTTPTRPRSRRTLIMPRSSPTCAIVGFHRNSARARRIWCASRSRTTCLRPIATSTPIWTPSGGRKTASRLSKNRRRFHRKAGRRA